MIKVCSKENGARLQELGVVLNTYFYHHDGRILNSDTHVVDGCIPAPTADELGEVLPYKIPKHETRYSLTIDKWESSYDVYYMGFHEEYMASADTLADAMCLMLIWLLEQGHITKEAL